jgi:FtsK/SpoIIIE family
MTMPTKAQLDRAAWLIKATDAEERAIHNLGHLITAADIDARNHANARADAVNFVGIPNNLAMAIPRYRRTDAATKQHIMFAYERLLTEMQESFGPGTKPRRIDHNALTVEARPYLLGDFVKLDVAGILPRLCFERSNPAAGILTYIVSGGFADPAPWKAALPQIAAYLGAAYRLTASTATTITLTRSPELAKLIPLNPAWLVKGNLLLGIDVDTQRAVQLPLDKMTHTLISGTPGMGKSVFLHLLLNSCLHSIDQFEHVYAICGQGIAFERYRGLHPKLTVNNDPEHFYELAERLQTTMRDRTARLVADKRDKMGNYILVLVDEWGAFNNPEGTDKAAKEAHAAFLRNITNIGKRGRKNGLRLMFVVQEPVDRDLASGVRSSLSSILSFRLPLAAHGQSLFGEITPPAVPADVRTLPVGRAIFHSGITGTRTLVQIPVTEPPRGRT